eukprot:GHVT01045653.1.p1 GENE.GHVT01045653.1~~GHVT01045653.1.p1  ORF type:complete len:604 (-),score=48.87 GHVT01045653.1:1289-3100(-)
MRMVKADSVEATIQLPGASASAIVCASSYKISLQNGFQCTYTYAYSCPIFLCDMCAGNSSPSLLPSVFRHVSLAANQDAKESEGGRAGTSCCCRSACTGHCESGMEYANGLVSPFPEHSGGPSNIGSSLGPRTAGGIDQDEELVDNHCLVHRLDIGTTGAVIFAKSPKVQSNLRDQFKQRLVRKVYLAVCWDSKQNLVVNSSQIVDLPLARDHHRRGRVCVAPAVSRTSAGLSTFPSSPRECSETIEVPELSGTKDSPVDASRRRRRKNTKNVVGPTRGAASLVRPLHLSGKTGIVALEPRTGRTHQLRCHMAAIGAPIIGDSVYGKADVTEKFYCDIRKCLQVASTRRTPTLYRQRGQLTPPETNNKLESCCISDSHKFNSAVEANGTCRLTSPTTSENARRDYRFFDPHTPLFLPLDRLLDAASDSFLVPSTGRSLEKIKMCPRPLDPLPSTLVVNQKPSQILPGKMNRAVATGQGFSSSTLVNAKQALPSPCLQLKLPTSRILNSTLDTSGGNKDAFLSTSPQCLRRLSTLPGVSAVSRRFLMHRRPLLHALLLELQHPITGEMLSVAAPLPLDLQLAMFHVCGDNAPAVVREAISRTTS